MTRPAFLLVPGPAPRRARPGPARCRRRGALVAVSARDGEKKVKVDVRPEVGNRGLFSVNPERVDEDPETNLRGFIKTRGSLVPGEEFVFWWTGDIYGMVDEQASTHLFAFEGYNIGRMVRVDGGWRMLTREVGLYKDATTGEILTHWTNPKTQQTHQVVHVWNDPVNQQFLLRNSTSRNGSNAFRVPTTRSGDDLYWHAEVFLKYPSPLPKAEYPSKSQSDFYQSAELFQFYTKAEDLQRDEPSAPCLISWVRVGQWLPWMDMGDSPGKMVYHCRGKKLEGGYMDLPPAVREIVEREHPEYQEAPTNFQQPNETSWSYYKKLLGQKGAPRADGTIAKRPKEEERAPQTAEAPFVEKSARDIVFTRDQLARFNGVDPSKPIYLSVMGRVFDVTKGAHHYRIGEPYNSLTGKDSTVELLTGRLPSRGPPAAMEAKKVDVDIDVDAMSADQLRDIANWIEFFGKQYPEIGRFPGWRTID